MSARGGRRAAAFAGPATCCPPRPACGSASSTRPGTPSRYGYGEIVTPTFEETEVFVRGVGTSTDVVRKEMYTFDDRAGRSPDPAAGGPAPVVRAFVQHEHAQAPAAD